MGDPIQGLKNYFKNIAYPKRQPLPSTKEAAWNRVRGLSNEGKKPPIPSLMKKLK